MTLPTPKSFSTDIEVRFPDDAPEGMEDWYGTLKENLNRLREKVLILESTDIATLQRKVSKLERQIKELS